MYSKIAELQANFADSEKIAPLLASFSQHLIDYVSLGHFGIYEKLMAKKQQPLAALTLATKLYPAFANTTATAILFNDAYVGGKRNWHSDNLVRDLSKLGEQLAKRMEIEDWLCRML
jgi:regulator of sigma D